MLIKIYDKILRYIKQNYKFFIIISIIILLFIIPTNYEIYSPGGLIDLKKRVVVDNSTISKGSYNLTYVGAKKGIIPFIILSYIIPDWDLKNINESRYEEESLKEIIARDKLSLKEANSNSIFVAFEEAKKDYKILKEEVVVFYAFEDADTNLKVGDIILNVENKNIDNALEFTNIINSYEVGDNLNIKVKRNNEIIDAYAKVSESNNKKVIGLLLITIFDIKTNPKVTFNYKNNESGASCGLMNALAIYDMLVKEDITKGRIISGTGYIDRNGNIEKISGIKYKLAGAVKNKANIFIVPSDNYKEALKEKNKHNYKIKLIKADTFKNVIAKLKE